MNNYFFTLGSVHGGPGHVLVRAACMESARGFMVGKYGPAWAFMYSDIEQLHPNDRMCRDVLTDQREPEPLAYRLESLGGSSAQFGTCEVCNQPADNMYYLETTRRYCSADGTLEFQTIHDCRPGTYGHKNCLARLTE